jgi:hypothetical protein
MAGHAGSLGIVRELCGGKRGLIGPRMTKIKDSAGRFGMKLGPPAGI